MRVIICGAGEVGYNIASYLAREDNDVTVIDTDPHVISQINETLDVKGIVGHASNPEILDLAGASEMDLIIAVTDLDEVNMVACQVAHTLFNVPKKIARVREQAYLDPAWANLFSRFHMPIDYIISPEIEVAHSINRRLRVPGTTNVIPLAEGKVFLIGVFCSEDCPIINTQLKQLPTLFPTLSFRIAAIFRKEKATIPRENDQIFAGDEVYFFVEKKDVKRAMAAFGHEEKEARRIVIAGGGKIGLYLTNLIREQHKGINIKIIEINEECAIRLSEEVDSDVIVLHGDCLDQNILEEADIRHTETMVAVTNDDETNILASLLAKQQGCQRVITLARKPSFTTLTGPLGIDATVSPRTSTVSSIMRFVRRGRIKALYNLREGFAEVIEAEVSESSTIANLPLSALSFPDQVMFGAIVRGDEVIIPTSETIIRPGDHVITLAAHGFGRQVEKMFMVQVDLF